MTRRVRRPARAVTEDGGTLADLNRRLTQHQARARRARRKYLAADEVSDPASGVAHQEWSDAVEGALRTVEAISVAPVHDLRDLLIAFEAAWWWARLDDNVIDASTRRWLGRFRRTLRRLVREG